MLPDGDENEIKMLYPINMGTRMNEDEFFLWTWYEILEPIPTLPSLV